MKIINHIWCESYCHHESKWMRTVIIARYWYGICVHLSDCLYVML